MNRRKSLELLGTIGMSAISGIPLHQNLNSILHRRIPSTGEQIPVIGMGSWITFDVLNSSSERNMRNVLSKFHQLGGRVIDSSPMYGTSEQTIGKLANELSITKDLWISTKVWTDGQTSGRRQIEQSNRFFANRVRVNHVHNIRDFNVHYHSLQEAKERGKIKYIGVTHYLNHAHKNLIDLIKTVDLDFVQCNYNIGNTAAEYELLPAAMDHGVAIIINKPFQTGRLFNYTKDQDLPPWAKEMGIKNWASFMLKYIISHPGVTCAIPATSQVAHVIENMEAGTGTLPSEQDRKRMLSFFQSIL